MLSTILMLALCSSEAPPAVREATPPPAPWWLARPWHTEPKILKWAGKRPDIVSLEKLKTFRARTAYAVTVTGAGPAQNKVGILFTQPHAHEPATTAGMMDLLSQLIDGVCLDGKPADPACRVWLDRAVLTFIPDGNPDGRARAPEAWWDGTHTNKDFLDWAFGLQSDGGRCARVGRWSLAEQQPAWIGFAYEQLNDREFVEPNRDRGSTFFRLIERVQKKHAFFVHADLHQTEFERSPHDSMIILPFLQKDLPEPLRTLNQQFGEAVVAAWRNMGASPIEEVKPLGYREDQLRYFRQCWSEFYRQQAHVTFEIQNNNRRTPPRKQLDLMVTGMKAVVEFALKTKN